MNTESQIQNFAIQLANEISERNIMNIDEVATMIAIRIKIKMPDFVKENATYEESEYIRLIQELRRMRPNTPQWYEQNYKISLAKHRKANANRAVHNAVNQKCFSKNNGIRTFIIDNHGQEAWDMLVKNPEEATK
jgi:hypothetical protein